MQSILSGGNSIQLSAVAGAILEWAVNNNLQLNLGKTKAIVFGSVPCINKLGSIARTHIMIGGVAVHLESSVRKLCMILSSLGESMLIMCAKKLIL